MILKRESLFSIINLLVLIAYQAGIYSSYSQSTRGDFAIYFRAGLRVRQGLEIYDFQENLYVYGPLLAHLLSFFYQIPIQSVSNLWLLTGILLSWANSFLLIKLVTGKVSLSKFVLTLGLMTLSFAFRNNAGNGSVMMIVLFCFLVVFYSSKRQSVSFTNLVLASSFAVFAFELKTYLAVYLILYLIAIRRFEIILTSLILIALTNIFYYFEGSETYFEWIKAIVVRSQNIETGSDQATMLIYSKLIFPNSPLVSWAISLIFFLILGGVSKILIRKDYASSKFLLLIFAVAPLGTIFAHGQDFVFSVASLAGFILQNKKVPLRGMTLIFSLSTIINWTNSELLPGVVASLTLVLILKTCNIVQFGELISIIVGLFSSLLALNWLRYTEGDLQFRYYNFQGFLFACSVWLLITRILDDSERTYPPCSLKVFSNKFRLF